MTPLVLFLLAAPTRPPADADRDHRGRGVLRTMSPLSAGTAEKPSPIRILFYGQSITEQDWWKAVVADLRARFPTAIIDAQNRAIGGFSSQRLVLTAEHDRYPFAPDLLISHVCVRAYTPPFPKPAGAKP